MQDLRCQCREQHINQKVTGIIEGTLLYSSYNSQTKEKQNCEELPVEG